MSDTRRRVLLEQKERLLGMVSELDGLLDDKIDERQNRLSRRLTVLLSRYFSDDSLQGSASATTESWGQVSNFTLDSENSAIMVSKQSSGANTFENESPGYFDSMLDESQQIGVLFGGQGFDTIADLKSLYSSQTAPIFKLLSRVLTLDIQKYTSSDFKLGFDFHSWMNEATDIPDSYKYSTFISFPLTLIVQILTYLTTLRKLKITHEIFMKHVSSSANHSQGILASFLIACSRTDTDLASNIVMFIRLALSIGVHCDEKLSTSPMLSIRGLTIQALKNLINEKGYKSVEVGLKNDENTCVVVGDSKDTEDLRNYVKQQKLGSAAFIRTSGYFHHSKHSVTVKEIVKRCGFFKVPLRPSFKVYDTENGKLLKYTTLEHLVSLQIAKFHDFTVIPAVRRYIDFGPGDVTAKMFVAINSGVEKVFCCSGKLRTSRTLDQKLVGIDYLVKLSR